MLDQASFDFSTPPAPPAADEVTRLVDHLQRAGETWLTAKQLAGALSLSDRKIRSLAEHSDGRVISGPGCPGYRHVDHCTLEILNEVSNRLASQARAMYRRSIRIRKLAHSILR